VPASATLRGPLTPDWSEVSVGHIDSQHHAE
jgi:hypothetical protein